MIVWDEDKNSKLKLGRNISFEIIADIVLNKKYLDIIDHPSRHNQSIFVMELNSYVHAVPFVMDEKSNIILKTAFPSRKLNKKYKETKDEKY